MRPGRHAPLGRCLYCLANGVPLTEEHLIPRAIGGRLTLRDAVCESCRRITGRLEQATLAREFCVPKTLLALKRRRARGDGPSRMPPVVLAGEGGKPSVLTADTFPRSFALPVFQPAGLLADRPAAHTPPRIDVVECRLNLGTPTRHTVAATLPLADPHAYAWSVAKWAYAMAVAERGLDCCDTRPMRDLMLGRRNDVFAFVGSPSPCEAAPREWLHDAAVHENGRWLTVSLALFASAGMVPYEVVVGRI